MSSLDSLQSKQILKKGEIVHLLDDKCVAIRLRYVGTGSVTSVTTTTGTNIVMVTSDGGTDTYAFTTYSTVGLLADAINADGIFEAKVLDGLRSDATASKFVDGAITSGTDANGVVVWDVLTDTSGLDKLSACLSPHRDFDSPNYHRVHLRELSYYANVNAGSANAVRIYRRRGTVETQVYGATSVDATVTTINWASGEGYLTGNPDDEFIVSVQDATSITDDTANYIRVVGEIE